MGVCVQCLRVLNEEAGCHPPLTVEQVLGRWKCSLEEKEHTWWHRGYWLGPLVHRLLGGTTYLKQHALTTELAGYTKKKRPRAELLMTGLAQSYPPTPTDQLDEIGGHNRLSFTRPWVFRGGRQLELHGDRMERSPEPPPPYVAAAAEAAELPQVHGVPALSQATRYQGPGVAYGQYVAYAVDGDAVALGVVGQQGTIGWLHIRSAYFDSGEAGAGTSATLAGLYLHAALSHTVSVSRHFGYIPNFARGWGTPRALGELSFHHTVRCHSPPTDRWRAVSGSPGAHPLVHGS